MSILVQISIARGMSTGTAHSPRAEVRAALSELGYGPDEIRVALERLGEAADGEKRLP